MKFVLALMAVLCLLSSAAEARHGHHSHHSHIGSHLVAGHSQHFVRHHGGIHREVALGDRPHRARGVPWCGIWLMQHTGIHGPGNLAMAREWAHVGQPAPGPAPGIIGVMAHHVFQVIQVLGRDRQGNETVLAISGNDGNAVRTRPRSTAGVIAWRRV